MVSRRYEVVRYVIPSSFGPMTLAIETKQRLSFNSSGTYM